jgi:hypothetical protein
MLKCAGFLSHQNYVIILLKEERGGNTKTLRFGGGYEIGDYERAGDSIESLLGPPRFLSGNLSALQPLVSTTNTAYEASCPRATEIDVTTS